MIINNTPLEEYVVNGVTVLVKREDLCCTPPGPSFSKVRGVFAHIQSRPESTIGVLDTFHSKAGWAVIFVGQHLGKKVINYYPEYKHNTEIREQQLRAQSMGAELVGLPAGMSAILFHQAKRHLATHYSDSYMMPNALKLWESVLENAEEARRTPLPLIGTLVISISSGTVAAGVIKGAPVSLKVVLHMGYTRSEAAVQSYVEWMSEMSFDNRISIVDEGYQYKDEIKDLEAPFPCDSFYDLKAWKWLHQPGVVESLVQPIVFWNIGA